MPTLDAKIRFAETYVKNKEGNPFSLAGRSWVRDQFWLPADGFKLWRRPDSDPCQECATEIGTIVETPDDNPTAGCACGGLDAQPIIVTILNLQRQDGKTFSSMAYALATLYQSRNKSFALLAASEDQAETLFRENYCEAIRQHPKLESRAHVLRMRLEIPKTHGILEALSTAHRSATGRTRTHILIDEARDIESRVVTSLIPAVFSQQGIECPNGHVQLSQDESANAPKSCSACGERLRPWYGRIIITSSSGIIEGTERDWLAEMIDLLEKEPRPNYHVFRSDVSLNPKKSKVIMSAVEDVLSQLDSTRHYIAAEIGNTWAKKGEDFVTRMDLQRCTDKTLINCESCSDPAIAFLDTSITEEKTSLVIVADDSSKSERPWEFIYEARLDYWIPEHGGAINPADVLFRLDAVMPSFTRLRHMYVDTRGMPWAVQLVQDIRKSSRPWRLKVKSWTARSTAESDAGWNALQQRIRSSPPTIRLQEDKAQLAEFVNLRWKHGQRQGANRMYVADRSRGKQHKDITESLALCCHLVAVEIMAGGGLSLGGRSRASGGIDIRRMLDSTVAPRVSGSLSAARKQIGLGSGRSRGPIDANSL